jgi:hypothetical protein
LSHKSQWFLLKVTTQSDEIGRAHPGPKLRRRGIFRSN